MRARRWLPQAGCPLYGVALPLVLLSTAGCPARLVDLRKACPVTSAREGQPGRRVSHPSARGATAITTSRVLAVGFASSGPRSRLDLSKGRNFPTKGSPPVNPALDVGPSGQAAKGASHTRYASISTQGTRRDASLHNPAARARRAAAQGPRTQDDNRRSQSWPSSSTTPPRRPSASRRSARRTFP